MALALKDLYINSQTLAFMILLALTSKTFSEPEKNYLLPINKNNISKNNISKNNHEISSRYKKNISFRGGMIFGVPTTKQNIDIQTDGLLLNIQTTQWLDLFPLSTSLSVETQLQRIITDGGNGTLIAIGPKLETPIFKPLSFSASGKVGNLNKYVYAVKEISKKKNYGGKRQFLYHFDLKYNFSKKISIGYRWQHMSNGNAYEHNPVLETHNVFFISSF